MTTSTAPRTAATGTSATASIPTTPTAAAPAGTTASAPAQLLATTFSTPAGDLAVVLTTDGVVRAAGFSPLDDQVARLSAAARAGGVRRVDARELEHADASPGAAHLGRAVRAYAAGDGAALDDVPVEQPGGPFFQAAWVAMRRIPAGETRTYSQLAAAAGSPSAVRAAGSACARNLVAPFVPCHRVVRTGGDLGGYYYGLPAKRALLRLEAGDTATVAAGRS